MADQIEEVGPATEDQVSQVEEVGPATLSQRIKLRNASKAPVVEEVPAKSGPADMVAEAWNGLNPVETLVNILSMAKPGGLRDAMTNYDQAIKATQGRAKADWNKPGLANKISGAGRYAASVVPVIGPAIEDAADTIVEDPWRGAGKTIPLLVAALGGPKATEEVSAPGLSKWAEKRYRADIKPGRALTREAQDAMVSEGLERGIEPRTFEGADKARGAINEINTEIDAAVNSPKGQARSLDPNQFTKNIDEAASKSEGQYTASGDRPVYANAKEDYLDKFRTSVGPAKGPTRNMSAAEAHNIKKATYREVGDKAYDRDMTSTSEKAQMAGAKDMKEAVESVFPEFKGKNELEGVLLDIEKHVEQNAKLDGSRTPAGSHETFYGDAKAVLRKALKNPNVRNRVTMALYRAGKSKANLSVGARIDAFLNQADNKEKE